MITPSRKKEITNWVIQEGDLRKAHLFVKELMHEVHIKEDEVSELKKDLNNFLETKNKILKNNDQYREALESIRDHLDLFSESHQVLSHDYLIAAVDRGLCNHSPRCVFHCRVCNDPVPARLSQRDQENNFYNVVFENGSVSYGVSATDEEHAKKVALNMASRSAGLCFRHCVPVKEVHLQKLQKSE